MKVYRAYKVELNPNNAQRSLFVQAAGCARWAYNWGLRNKIDAYAARKAEATTTKTPTAFNLCKQLVLLKHQPIEDGGVPWMCSISKSVPQNAIRNLDKAFDAFFRRCKAKTPGPKGFPRFKSKKNGIGSFTVEAYRITSTHIHIARVGLVRLKEHGYIPADSSVRVLSISVSEKAGRWFASVQVERGVPESVYDPCLPAVGVDAGVKELATCSDGRVFANPKALANGLAKLKRLQRQAARKQKGSNNRRKAVAKVAKQHYRISCIRKDAIHKASDAITKHCSAVVLEDLNVAGMLRNRKLARAVSDASMSELRRQIEYKAAWRGVRVITASHWYPSSKTCSACGAVRESLPLSERVFSCHTCGHVQDRDLNAAINLQNLAVSSTVTACGVEGAGRPRKRSVKPATSKQELNTAQTCLNGSV